MTELRFIYFACKSLTRCEDMLEHYFATGEICLGERPRIEKRGNRWCITLPG